MTWTDPNTRNTGDLITAQIFNDEIIGNLAHLHDQYLTIFYTPQFYPSVAQMALSGSAMVIFRVQATPEYVYFGFRVPDNVDSVESIEWILIPNTSETIQYSLLSGYSAEGELYDTHAETANNQTLPVTVSEVTHIDVSSVFSSISAGDLCFLRIASYTADIDVVGLMVTYKLA